MPVRLVLLGTGVWALNFHLPALVSSAAFNVVGIWGRSAKSAETAVALPVLEAIPNKPKAYWGDEGLAAIFADPNVDAVLSALPITAQPDVVIMALRAGKHVLSEKPLHKDVDSAEKLIEAYENNYKPKGLIWRVAENYAHESLLNEVAKELDNPAIGPVLYWQLAQQSHVAPGSMFHATAWRTIPDYQGGFVLDGGVHMPAVLRSVLPIPPASIISNAALHRSHLPPHDVVMGLALPPAAAYTAPHGGAVGDVSRMPVLPGRSGPTGTVVLSWAAPEVDRKGRPSSSLEITCLNGIIYVERHMLSWKISIQPTKESGLQERILEGAMDGIQVQANMWARAIDGSSSEPNLGEPRSALWDLRFIEAMLTSDGKEVSLGEAPFRHVI